MRQIHTTFAALMLGLIATTSATAQIDVYIDNVDNSSQLTGYVTQDLSVDTVADWTCAAMCLELDEGSIYQDSAGNMVEPSYFAVLYFPTLAFDTYLAGGTWGVGVLGAGGDAGGGTYQFDHDRLDLTWKGNSSDEIGLTRIARVTLSDDASGTWRLVAMQIDDDKLYRYTGTIVDGVMVIEP